MTTPPIYHTDFGDYDLAGALVAPVAGLLQIRPIPRVGSSGAIPGITLSFLAVPTPPAVDTEVRFLVVGEWQPTTDGLAILKASIVELSHDKELTGPDDILRDASFPNQIGTSMLGGATCGAALGDIDGDIVSVEFLIGNGNDPE